MASTLEIINGISQAMSNVHDGAMDEDGNHIEIGLKREHKEWVGLKTAEWKGEIINSFDAVLISTAHDVINWQELADWMPLIIDTRNAMQHVNSKPNQVWKV